MAGQRKGALGERVVGVFLLLILVGLCVFFLTAPPYYKKQDLTALSAEPAQSLPQSSTSARVSSEPLLPALIPETVWERDGPVEVYPEERLYEKIDGLDERYKLYGVRQLLFASYASAESPQERLDVYCYEMASPLAALGIFGREKPPGVNVSSEFGDAGYQIECTAYFRKGRYYVQIRGYSEAAREACDKMATYLSRRIPQEQSPLVSFPFLPREGRIPGSERFEPEDAVLGTGFLKNVFSAEYLLKEDTAVGEPAILFVVPCASEDAALQAQERYLQYLSRQGKVLRKEEIQGISVTLMDLDGLFEAFWTQGEVFAGVAEAPDQGTLLKLADSLIKTLKAQPAPTLPTAELGRSPPAGTATKVEERVR